MKKYLRLIIIATSASLLVSPILKLTAASKKPSETNQLKIRSEEFYTWYRSLLLSFGQNPFHEDELVKLEKYVSLELLQAIRKATKDLIYDPPNYFFQSVDPAFLDWIWEADISATDIHIKDNQAKATVTFKKDLKRHIVVLSYHRENGEWKIDRVTNPASPQILKEWFNGI